MNALRRISVDLRWPLVLLSVLVVAQAFRVGHSELLTLRGSALVSVTLFFVAIVLGEMARLRILTGRETAPMSTAAAFGLTLSAVDMPGGRNLGAAPVVLVVAVAMVVGSGALRAVGSKVSWVDLAARIAGVSLAPLLYRYVEFDGQTLVERQVTWIHQRSLGAVVMLLVGGLTMLTQIVLEATAHAGRDHAPLIPSVVDELRSTLALATALVTSGALIALADVAIGIAALPLFLFPLLLTSFAVQRNASIRTTYRQTIGALSSLTDRAGYTVSDHAQRVADVSLAIGRDMGMGQRELTDLEYAALLHDLGQVALREPIPAGATVMAAPADQQRIAHDGAEIVRTTGVLDNVASILEAQTTPYRQVREFGQDLPMSSRIIKVANAYDDLCEPGGDNHRAMERIHLGLGYEYDPRVVDSLTRILERRRRSAPSGS
ncbi:MAG: HD domain-containing phosphohydrolase [Pedococcus sp.]